MNKINFNSIKKIYTTQVKKIKSFKMPEHKFISDQSSFEFTNIPRISMRFYQF